MQVISYCKEGQSHFDPKHIKENLRRQSVVHLALLCNYTYAPKARRNWLCRQTN